MHLANHQAEVGLNAWLMMSASSLEKTALFGAVMSRLLPNYRQCAREDCIIGRLSRVEALNQLDEPGFAQKMAPFADNPFAALTIVVAPAILTNASAVLCLGTANRLVRVVDRTRVISRQLTHTEVNVNNHKMYQKELEGLEVRWNLILRALRLFYLSLGSFAAAALISLFGTILTPSALHIGFPLIAFLGLLSGTVGVAGLIVGCATMMQETRLAVRSLVEEAQAVA